MDDDKRSYGQRLLHRWFVQYNPLYLLSAALVLLGAHLLYRDLLKAGFLVGQLGVPAIAELYAWALVAGAALLTRIELRRPAVLLAMLAVLFQGDLTMLTETSVYLGGAGAVATALWLASFAAKLRGIAWALRLRPSRSALVVPLLGAVGLVLMPHVFVNVAPESASLVLGAFGYVVFAAGAWTSRAVGFTTAASNWARTVLRRGLAAIWATWSVLLTLHLWFAASEHGVSMVVLGPVAMLLATRCSQRERSVWVGVGAAVGCAAIYAPAALWLIALSSAITLGLHAMRWPCLEVDETSAATGPYREADAAAASEPRVVHGFSPAPPGTQRRLLAGALATTYLGLWTLGWSGGALPQHTLLLDAALTMGVFLGVHQRRLYEPLMPLVAVHLHHAVARRWLELPDTRLEWGLLAVGSGFGLLLGSLALAYRLRPRQAGHEDLP
jgi:hypothetical protein